MVVVMIIKDELNVCAFVQLPEQRDISVAPRFGWTRILMIGHP